MCANGILSVISAGAAAMFGYFDTMLRYFELRGRSSRRQYFMYQLTLILLVFGAVWLDWTVDGVPPSRERLGFFTLFVTLVHFVPGITLTVRRLHDSGRSGWWALIGLVPLIGGIWLFILMCLGPDGYGANAYGDDPRDGPVFDPGTPRQTRSQQFLADMAARRGMRA